MAAPPHAQPISSGPSGSLNAPLYTRSVGWTSSVEMMVSAGGGNVGVAAGGFGDDEDVSAGSIGVELEVSTGGGGDDDEGAGKGKLHAIKSSTTNCMLAIRENTLF